MLPKPKHFFSILMLLCCCLGCSKEIKFPEKVYPKDYQEMFEAVKLKFDITYNYVEMINNSYTGNRGTVRFSLSDTSITETFNTYTTKDYFSLDSLEGYTCKFINKGLNRHAANKSVFINNARQTLSYVNNVTMVSFSTISNGSYYYHQYILSH